MPEVILCGTGESLFKKVGDKFWADIRSRQAFYRICSLMRLMGVNTIIHEHLECANDSCFHRKDDFLESAVGTVIQ